VDLIKDCAMMVCGVGCRDGRFFFFTCTLVGMNAQLGALVSLPRKEEPPLPIG
jgi:hypothetical protein